MIVGSSNLNLNMETDKTWLDDLTGNYAFTFRTLDYK